MMDKNEETLETWRKVAGLYEEKFMHLDLYNEGYDFFCSQLPRTNASVLEVGCGPGNITRHLLDKRPDLQIFGIDYAASMVALAKKNNPTANFDVMDCRKIGELKERYDGIICGFCIPYLSPGETVDFITDCSRLLKEQGSLYISFVEGEPSASGFLVASTGDRTFFYYHTLNFLNQALAKNSFNVPRIFSVEYQKPKGPPELHTVLITTKRSRG